MAEAKPTHRAAAREERAARLEKALRDNLRRRKEQARAQTAARQIGSDAAAEKPAG